MYSISLCLYIRFRSSGRHLYSNHCSHCGVEIIDRSIVPRSISIDIPRLNPLTMPWASSRTLNTYPSATTRCPRLGALSPSLDGEHLPLEKEEYCIVAASTFCKLLKSQREQVCSLSTLSPIQSNISIPTKRNTTSSNPKAPKVNRPACKSRLTHRHVRQLSTPEKTPTITKPLPVAKSVFFIPPLQHWPEPSQIRQDVDRVPVPFEH
jgi:hypothetical protein